MSSSTPTNAAIMLVLAHGENQTHLFSKFPSRLCGLEIVLRPARSQEKISTYRGAETMWRKREFSGGFGRPATTLARRPHSSDVIPNTRASYLLLRSSLCTIL